MLSRTVPAATCADASAPARNTSGIGFGDRPQRALRSSGGARMGRAGRRSSAARLDGTGPALGLADAHADTGTDEFTEMERRLAQAGHGTPGGGRPPRGPGGGLS